MKRAMPLRRPFSKLLQPWALSALGLAGLLGAAGCGEDELPVRAEVAYQVRCGGSAGCSVEPVRMVDGLHGSGQLFAYCEVSSTGLLTVEFRDSDDLNNEFGFDLRRVGAAGSCEVRLHEGGNSYHGACSTQPPTSDVPCQVTVVEEADGAMSGELRCNELRHRNAPFVTSGPGMENNRFRNISFPGNATQPGTFRFERCRQL